MENIVIVNKLIKDFSVRLKTNRCSPFFSFSDNCDRLGNFTAGERHLIDLSVTINLDFQPFRKRIDNRCSDSVETAGNLISSATEFSAGMQHRKDNLKG